MKQTPRRQALRALGAALALPALAGPRPSSATAAAGSAAASPTPVRVASGLEHPWALAFLPDGSMLVTERPGRLRRVSPDGRVSAPISGVPAVHANGQGGLLDVALGPGFAQDRGVFLSFAQPTRNGARTAVARGTLSADGGALRDVSVIFAQKDDPSGGHHFGSRLVFAGDGTLFVTLGDRYGHRDRAQDPGSHLGKIVRIRADGSVPKDNPFVGRGGTLPEIHSLGHRNVQGAALHPSTGALWTHEHGPQGGDELNLEKPGANYGWPVVTHGREYVTGFRIGDATERAGIEPALHQWTPSIAPSGMAFLTS
ncbi:MAG TPA: PQQ-dependent sugar dehydrogenase, partial [Quisquiliibacterium sp.]|nr:PQQ-dependent sugar dehydrogenase [Quisquiliibacterium sp.]